jgi:hypothetical protein
MPRGRLIRAAILGCALAPVFATSALAGGALVRVNNIVLHADGGFEPRSLPRRQFTPIDFQGYLDVAAKDGGRPPALQKATVDFDRDGRLSAGGLPVCAPERVANVSPKPGRRAPGRSSAQGASRR